LLPFGEGDDWDDPLWLLLVLSLGSVSSGPSPVLRKGHVELEVAKRDLRSRETLLARGRTILLSSEIIGKEVIGSQGERLGTVRDIQFDEKGWNVLAIGVQLDKEVADEHNLGHRFRKTEVLISVKHIQAVGDKVILTGSSKELLQLITPLPG